MLMRQRCPSGSGHLAPHISQAVLSAVVALFQYSFALLRVPIMTSHHLRHHLDAIEQT